MKILITDAFCSDLKLLHAAGLSTGEGLTKFDIARAHEISEQRLTPLA